MTIKFIADYSPYKIGNTVTLTSAEETALVGQKVAVTNLTGGVPYVPETPSTLSSLVKQLLSGPQSSHPDIAGVVGVDANNDIIGPSGEVIATNAITRFSDSVRYYIPHPLYCFSDVAGTTPAVKDGPVGLWRDTLDRGNPATQGTAGARPILRSGAKNLLVNSTMQGGVDGSPGTLPNGYNAIGVTGVNRTINYLTEVVDGVSTRFARIRFFGTSTSSGASGFDINLANTIAATQGMRFNYQVFHRLFAGSFPVTTVPWRIELTQLNSAGSPVGVGSLVSAASANATWQPFTVSSTISDATATSVTCQNRFDVAINTVVDFTIDIAMPMLASGTLTPSAYVATSGAPASNGVGPWWLDFDGVQTRLEFTQPVVRAGEGVFTCVATEPYMAVTSAGAPIWHGNNETNERYGALLYDNAAREISARYTNAAGVSGNAVTSMALRGIYSTYIAPDNTVMARYNSARKGQNNVQAPPKPYNISNSIIGAARRNSSATPDLWYRGGIYGMALGNVTPTETEALAAERFIASVAEITL